MYKLARIRSEPDGAGKNRIDFIFTQDASSVEHVVSLTNHLSNGEVKSLRAGVEQGWDTDWRWRDIPRRISGLTTGPAIVSILRNTRHPS